MKKIYLFLIIFIILITIIAIFTLLPFIKKPFEVKDFMPVANYKKECLKNKEFTFDYTDAIDSGFVIPSIRQVDGGLFIFQFSVKNNSGKPSEFYYKIYYQDESYKFPEFITSKTKKLQHPFADENFYGSWEDTNTMFVSTGIIPADGNFHTVTAKLRITGNPRNEKTFYGHPERASMLTEKNILDKENIIKSYPAWYNMVVKKAAENKRPLNKQLRIDAEYAIGIDCDKTIINQRWKRNPRTGYYSFMLVVTTADKIKNNDIPAAVQNISLTENGKFVNPYYYFLYGTGAKLRNTTIIKADSIIKVTAKPSMSKGIYIDTKHFKEVTMHPDFYNNLCNSSAELFKTACFAQFFHKIDTNEKFNNISSKEDIYAFTMEKYQKNSQSDPTDFVTTTRKSTDCPCQTAGYNTTQNTINITNPGFESSGKMKKENAGIRTRHGFTYGTYTVKIKMPELLNKYNVWTGLTNAIWLLYQEDEEWNYRRSCNKKGGYIPASINSQDSGVRKKSIAYSEIDFEILKANRYWPSTSYSSKKNVLVETGQDSDKIVITCTNWDMACWDPRNYDVGVREIKYHGDSFNIHRWDHWYKALTSKYPVKDDDVFGKDYYYFQIEWKPTEIIWRIGPEKDKLFVVGYMNDSITSIPNNQMLINITQEYHLSEWWPESRFKQNYIPFPLKNLTGNIYSIEIE